MEDKEVLRYVINGFELVPAKHGFANSYVTKNGKASTTLVKDINARIKKNFPNSKIRTRLERNYYTINFYRLMQESLAAKAADLLLELLEARSLSATNTARKKIIDKKGDLKITPGNKLDRVYAPDVTSDQFKELLSSLFADVTEVPAKDTEGGSKSSKFSTFKFKDGENEVSIVLAEGVKAGEEEETKEVTDLQSQITEKGGKEGITIRVGDIDYHDITTVGKAKNNKKADFWLGSDDKKVVFIQHKSLTHQQMAGIAKEPYSKFPEVQQFIEAVRTKVGQQGPLKQPVWRSIQSEDLKRLAAYGTTKGSFTNSEDAVQLYCVGPLKLIPTNDGKFTIGANEAYTYPEIPTGKNTPYLMATFRNDRNQAGISKTRLGIYPQSYVKGEEI